MVLGLEGLVNFFKEKRAGVGALGLTRWWTVAWTELLKSVLVSPSCPKFQRTHCQQHCRGDGLGWRLSSLLLECRQCLYHCRLFLGTCSPQSRCSQCCQVFPEGFLRCQGIYKKLSLLLTSSCALWSHYLDHSWTESMAGLSWILY